MRDYGTVSPKFWQAGTGKALRGDPDAQVLALYLMTSPHSSMTGIYFCTLGSMSYETGIPIEGASKALRRLIEEGFCMFDESTDEVFVVTMAEHQIGERLDAADKRCKGVQREVSRVNSTQLQLAFFERYAQAFNLVLAPVDNSASRSPFEAPSKPRAGAGAGAETRAGAVARETRAGPPPPVFEFPPEWKKFIESERQDLDPATVHLNFCEHYPPDKRTLTQWKKWVRREHANTGKPSTSKAGHAPPITVPGRAGRDPELSRLEADAARARPPPQSERARLKALRDQVAAGASGRVGVP